MGQYLGRLIFKMLIGLHIWGGIYLAGGGGEGVYTGAYQRDFTVINIININI